MDFAIPLKVAFDRINLLYTEEFELDDSQLEFARINVAANLIIALEAIIIDKGLSHKVNIPETLDQTAADFCSNLLSGKTSDTFKICASKDEASKLYLELTKFGISVDPQEMDSAECERSFVVKGILNIRRSKYVSFILSAKDTLGLAGSIAMKVSQDSLGRDEAKHIYDNLIPVITLLIEKIEEEA
ncbi:MAG: hypothetical protein CMK56_07655 [Proteobacteria bacterium]|nr:hypothetical protein [Pseudomonadota bacterium]